MVQTGPDPAKRIGGPKRVGVALYVQPNDRGDGFSMNQGSGMAQEHEGGIA